MHPAFLIGIWNIMYNLKFKIKIGRIQKNLSCLYMPTFHTTDMYATSVPGGFVTHPREDNKITDGKTVIYNKDIHSTTDEQTVIYNQDTQ